MIKKLILPIFLINLTCSVNAFANTDPKDANADNADFVLYIQNNMPQTSQFIEATKCWKINDDVENGILTIEKNKQAQVKLNRVCYQSSGGNNNYYKLTLMNQSMIIVRDLPQMGKRCVGILWHTPTLERDRKDIYCQSISDFKGSKIDFNYFSPDNTKVYKILPNSNGTGVLKTELLSPSNDI